MAGAPDPAGLELRRPTPWPGPQCGAAAPCSSLPPCLGVKTSMRNQWPCVVESVERLGPLPGCICRRPSRERWPWSLASRITAESAELLACSQARPCGAVQGHGSAGDAVCRVACAGVNCGKGA